MTDDIQDSVSREAGDSSNRQPPAATPTYQKPVLRKYDQIEQVKPYGPSELEAG